MCSIGEDDFGDDGGVHAMVKDNDFKEPSDSADISDIEEQEISFEEIGLLENAVKIGKIKKFVKLNLKIKRIPKQKRCTKLSEIKSSSSKPSTKHSLECDFDEDLTDESKSDITPKLCNGDNCPATDQILSAIEELRELVKNNCNETRDLRKELLGIKKEMNDDNPSYIPFTRGPCRSLDDFNLLENQVQEDESSREAVEEVLDKVPDPSLEKYIRNCLSAVISLKVASQCTWIAKRGSTLQSVHNMAIMRIMFDCIQKKYPTTSLSVIEKNVRTWLGQTKDRYRRTLEGRCTKSETDESLDQFT
ncbi:uncharacterized protein LOC129946762 [Eupeodes corollae]|uniref:uncharacterized protein LOC129946762 n=1 Tax=Eupeodes corollae TaxID=290404 RepID=UPI002491FCD0|nr:uncharacterized protein LOC129946762 [Eupeodes corollae]